MPRENADAKARRYLTEGRIVIRRVQGPDVDATARGTGAVWLVSHRRGPGWRCDCPARGPCAHILAVSHVVDVVGRSRR